MGKGGEVGRGGEVERGWQGKLGREWAGGEGEGKWGRGREAAGG